MNWAILVRIEKCLLFFPINLSFLEHMSSFKYAWTVGWPATQGTSASISSHTKRSWRFKEFTEEQITVILGGLFQYFTTRVEKDDLLPRRRLGPCSLMEDDLIKTKVVPLRLKCYKRFASWVLCCTHFCLHMLEVNWYGSLDVSKTISHKR